MKLTGQNHKQVSRGMLLMDCIMYVALYLVIVALAFTAFYSCWDNARDFRRAADSIGATLRIGERWRADIRTATGEFQFEDSPARHNLRIPQKKGEIDYGFFDGSVWRRTGQTGEWVEALPKVRASRMEAEKRREVTAWKWELELSTRTKKSKVLPLFTFEAVPQPEGSR